MNDQLENNNNGKLMNELNNKIEQLVNSISLLEQRNLDLIASYNNKIIPVEG